MTPNPGWRTASDIALELSGYVEALRRSGDLDELLAGHLAAIDQYLAAIDQRLAADKAAL